MTQFVTKEGLEKLQKEFENIKTVKRKEISERIAEAMKLGDLSENAEYHEARDEQGLNEARIRELEETLKNIQIIEEDNGGKGVVNVGCTIEVKSDGDKKTYTIVGSSEADPLKGLISNESPLGQAFLDKEKGEIAIVNTPRGPVEYKIINIS